MKQPFYSDLTASNLSLPGGIDIRFTRKALGLGCFRALVFISALLSLEVCNSVAVAGRTDADASDRDFLYPADSGMINVKEHGVRGDGQTDDTDAIQALIGRVKYLYFPVGTYLVSRRLEWKTDVKVSSSWTNYCYFVGQNRAKTIIKLKDSAPEYQDPLKPRGVIDTASQGGAPYPAFDASNGGGYAAFRNCVCDMTVDVGKGNPGAIGIDYMANNTGTIRNVTIRSGDGSGYSGLEMTRRWPGPCMITNVRIEGFDIGINIDRAEYSVTLEHISLAGQRVAGLRNSNNVVSIRDLKSDNSVPAVQNMTQVGMVTLVDADLKGGTKEAAAIENKGLMFVRDIRTSGYAEALKNGDEILAGPNIEEWTSRKVLSLFPSPLKSLRLPVEETPEWHDNDLSDWANVRSFEPAPPAIVDKNTPPPDDTTAIQAAIDSGKPTIYFPPGYYYIGDIIHVRGNVRRLIGFYSSFLPAKENKFDGANRRAVWRIENGSSDTVFFEQFISRSFGSNVADIEQATPRSLVVRNVSISSFRNTPNCGKLYLEDVQGNYHFLYPQKVWARQWNSEGGFSRAGMINNGGQVWILGVKTEGNETVVETTGEGKTEILGGLLYPNSHAGEIPAFINNESQFSMTFAESVSQPGRNYETVVRETRAGESKTLPDTSAYLRGAGPGAIAVPLYVGYQSGGADTNPPPAVMMYVVANQGFYLPVLSGTATSQVTMVAEAADADGIRDVEFFSGTQSLGKVANPPYVLKAQLPSGPVSYRLTAVATDGKGVSERSTPVDVRINQAPKVEVLEPAIDGLSLEAPAEVMIRAKVTDDRPKVTLYFQNTKDGSKPVKVPYPGYQAEGTVTEEYYGPFTAPKVTLKADEGILTHTFKGLPAGLQVINVYAMDRDNSKSVTQCVWAAVSDPAGPAINVVLPAEGANVSSDGVEIEAAVSPDASIKEVTFFDFNKRLSTVRKVPYRVKVKGLAPGRHTLFAQATDDQGRIRFSKFIHFSVAEKAATTPPANQSSP